MDTSCWAGGCGVVCQAQPLVLGLAEGLLDELRDVGVRESVIH
ncbi:hypothetical protein [Deinococcus humi]|uniref:Uncharacterized protein n=1 Tax=Deinococcus humi TaxID=662880 RepID=A0A7W8JWE1_9DEIO|nr:hypothetical protein [Deinococcus humi]MBB5364430.1 hypothetical protein [Deinococcus humi]